MQKAILTIAFDDGYLDTFKWAVPYLNRLGIKSTFAVPTGLIGKTCEKRPVLCWNHIKKMAKNGHEIASHTQHHVKFKTRNTKFETNSKFSRQQLDSRAGSRLEPMQWAGEIQNSKNIIERQLKKEVSSFVYPYLDKLPAKSIRNTVKDNYASARISKNFPVFNELPVKNPYNIKGFCIMTKHALPYLAKQIEKAMLEKLWLIEVFHLVGKTNTKSVHGNRPYRFFMNINDFKKHIDFVLSKKIRIMTQADVILTSLRGGQPVSSKVEGRPTK